jgi:predicted nuclease of restriction endonuclease-like (RecB) superfamily
MKPITPKVLLKDLRDLINEARHDVARQVNSTLVLLYWRVGKRIREDILNEKRAGYGEQIVATLSKQLTEEFGEGWSRYNLFRMIRFAECFPEEKIVATLSQQLGWSHFKEIIPLDGDLKRDFYAEMCRIERWSVRMLRQKIGGMLFERTALSKKPDKLIRHELDKLRFTFVARQKRIQVDNDDYYLDLLFYHRGLRRLVAIDLKLRDFQPADKGQMEFYLRWLAKYEQKPEEELPIGLILCAGKKRETIELMELEKGTIRVASYWTKVLPKKLLQKKLHETIQHARSRLTQMERVNDKNLLPE